MVKANKLELESDSIGRCRWGGLLENMNQKIQIRPLGSIVDFKSGGTPSKTVQSYWGGEFPWVSAKDLKSSIITDSIDHLSKEGLGAANVAPTNSLLILVRGMTLFKDVPVCLAGQDVAFNQDIKALVVLGDVDPKYLLFFLLSQKGKLLGLVDSAGHGTGRLHTDLLKAFPVLIPPLPEQTAIADLLSTWDVAIEKTERLITAKEKRFAWLRNGLINKEIAKGKWRHVKLGEVFSERVEPKFNDLPLLSITREEGVILRKDVNRKDTSNNDKSKYLRICPGDIGYNTMRMWQGVSALSTLEGIVSPAYTICIPSDRLFGEFISQYFKTQLLIDKFYRFSQGLTSDTWNLKFKHFKEIKVAFPPLNQQKQIASTLNTARREIDLLKKQLEAYRKQKRGLMQKLLTGQWRVKIKEK